jgi:hypothetical protein
MRTALEYLLSFLSTVEILLNIKKTAKIRAQIS